MTTPKKTKVRLAFFGTSHIAVYVLDALEAAGLLPALIITLPEKPKGRGLVAQPTAVEAWSQSRNIPTAHDWKEFEKGPPAGGWDVAVVVDYGKILPKKIVDIPKHGFLNVHPSLLPRLRGPSPMRSAILNDERAAGVSIILLDEEMDHGPLVAQKRVAIPDWPPKNSELEQLLLKEGGTLLAQILPHYVAGDILPQAQNHDVATYSEKFSKEDGLLDLPAGRQASPEEAYKNLLKIYAFEGWPGTYAFFERGGKKIRVQILDAHIEGTVLVIDKVKPEGKREMSYDEFLQSGAKVI